MVEIRTIKPTVQIKMPQREKSTALGQAQRRA